MLLKFFSCKTSLLHVFFPQLKYILLRDNKPRWCCLSRYKMLSLIAIKLWKIMQIKFYLKTSGIILCGRGRQTQRSENSREFASSSDNLRKKEKELLYLLRIAFCLRIAADCLEWRLFCAHFVSGRVFAEGSHKNVSFMFSLQWQSCFEVRKCSSGRTNLLLIPYFMLFCKNANSLTTILGRGVFRSLFILQRTFIYFFLLFKRTKPNRTCVTIFIL